MTRKNFTYEEASALIPEVRTLTQHAVGELEQILDHEIPDEGLPPEMTEEYQRIVSGWAESMIRLGAEVKGLWLIDFDSGGGYYCWQYPESALQFFHGYEEGFQGRVRLN